MRVLFVTNLWPDSERPWHGTFVHTQADSLRELGVEIDPFVIRGYASKVNYLRAMGSASRLNARWPGYDLVHAHYGYSGMVARLLVRAPVVLSYCGDDLLGTHDGTGRRTVKSRVEVATFRRLAHVCARTITKSVGMEEHLPEACRARNRVIPNGVDLDRFSPGDKTRARQEIGWDLDEKIVLFAGNPAIGNKNHPLAEEACRVLARTNPAVRLRVVYGVEPNAMPVRMRAADVLLVTSRSEGSANVIKEAMATELPVVSTATGDAPERLTGVAGCSVCPPDAVALAAGVERALAHGPSPEAREAVAPLSLPSVARRIVDVYEEALAS